MRLTFEYGKQKFTAELSDTNRNARLALNLAWDLVDEHTKLIFMPDYSKQLQPYELSDKKSLLKALSKKVKKNGSDNGS